MQASVQPALSVYQTFFSFSAYTGDYHCPYSPVGDYGGHVSMKADFRPQRAYFGPERAYSRFERVESRLKRADFRPGRKYFRPERIESRPERVGGGRMNGRMNRFFSLKLTSGNISIVQNFFPARIAKITGQNDLFQPNTLFFILKYHVRRREVVSVFFLLYDH